MADAYSLGVRTVEYSDYSSDVLQISGGKSQGYEYIDKFINNDKNKFKKKIKSILSTKSFGINSHIIKDVNTDAEKLLTNLSKSNTMNIINRALTLGLRIKEMVVLSLFALFGTFSEIIGLGVFYPIFEYMNMGGDINALTSDSQLWVRIVQLFNALGIKVSLFLLFSTSVSFIVLKALINYMKVIYIAKVSQNLIKKLRDKYFKYYMNATTS